MKIQIGYEHFNSEGKRDIRLTPISEAIKISPQAEALLGVLVMGLDANDIQPGDGEVDVKLTPSVIAGVKKAIPFIGGLVPADGNIFFRLSA